MAEIFEQDQALANITVPAPSASLDGMKKVLAKGSYASLEEVHEFRVNEVTQNIVPTDIFQFKKMAK